MKTTERKKWVGAYSALHPNLNHEHDLKTLLLLGQEGNNIFCQMCNIKFIDIVRLLKVTFMSKGKTFVGTICDLMLMLPY